MQKVNTWHKLEKLIIAILICVLGGCHYHRRQDFCMSTIFASSFTVILIVKL